MVGEDAVNSTTAMLEKLMQIILEIIRMRRERESRQPNSNKGSKEKQPKIKFGEMKKSEYKKMLNSGDKMHRIEVDKNKLDELNQVAKTIGAKYWVMNTDGNNATVIVPEKYFDQMRGAIEETTKLLLSKSPQSLAVHNSGETIPDEDISIVKDVLNYHDIPALSFKTDNGYMNVVSAEYDGQYQAAIKEALKLKEQIKNIDITVFEQTLPFELINKLDSKIMEVNAEQAQYIKANVPEAELLKSESGAIAVKYPNSAEEKIKTCSDNFSKDFNISQDYLITIVDSTITVNKEKLLINENSSEYFTRVPNSAGEDYIKIPKDEAQLLDGEKTISTKLDYDKTYQIFDKNGNLKTEVTGKELAAKYNTKSRIADKNTTISHYNNDSLDRIELYNAKNNKLISIGIESAEIVRKNLMDQGISSFAAEKLLKDINKALPQEFKEKFDYAPPIEKNEYSTIKNELLEQYKLADKIKNASLADGYMDTLGKKCCVLDKTTNQYVLVPASEDRLKEALFKMGYDKLQINVIVSEAQKSYSPSGATLERETVQAQSFETENAEVSAYKYFADGQGVILLKQELSDKDEVSLKYADISKEASRPEIEKALKNEFKMQDSASIAEILNCMEKKNLIPEAPAVATKDGFNISRVSSEYVKISRNSKTIIVDKNNVDIKKISDTFGISEKQAEKLKSSLDKSLKIADSKGGKGQSLNEIKNAAKKAYEKITAEKKAQAAEKNISAEFNRS